MAKKKIGKPPKFSTPEERQKAFSAFLKHIEEGYSPKTFHDPCVENTILKMLRDHPEEFDNELLQRAKAKGMYVWEYLGKAGAMGKIKGFNATAWSRIVENKLRWFSNVKVSGDEDAPIDVNVTGLAKLIEIIQGTSTDLPIKPKRK